MLIRDVPTDDLERIRAEALERGMTLQRYLLDTVRRQADYLRRQEALAGAARRLRGRRPVSEVDRRAILDAVEAAHTERGDRLGGEGRQ